MTETEKNERIKAVEEEMAKLQKELEDIRKEKTSEWDFSEWNNNKSTKLFYVTTDIPHDISDSLVNSIRDKFDFIMKLLKFKCCYDKEYEPDWEDGGKKKHYVYYDTFNNNNIFVTDYVNNMNCKERIYFSTQETAQKCADWLNAGCPEE